MHIEDARRNAAFVSVPGAASLPGPCRGESI